MRCGQCGELFDAIENLSPEPPEARAGTAPEPEPAEDATAEPVLRTVPAAEADDAADDADAPEIGGASIEEEPATEPAEEAREEPLRFGDDTPLEDILASLGEDIGEDAEAAGRNPDTDRASETAPTRRDDEPGGDAGEAAAADEETRLADREDWLSLLAELDLEETPPASGAASGESAPEDIGWVIEGESPAPGPGETVETPQAPASAPIELSLVDDAEPARDRREDPPDREEATGETDGEGADEDEEIDGSGILVEEIPAPGDAVPEDAASEGPAGPFPRDAAEETAEGGQEDPFALSGALFDELVESGQFEAILDEGPERRPRTGDEQPAPVAPSPAVVTPLVPAASPVTEAAGAGKTEAEKQRPTAEEQGPETRERRPAAQDAADDDEEIVDATLLPRRGSRVGLWSAAAVLLTLALGLQVVHGQRATLATLPELGPRLQGIYGALGMDLEPYWDIGALCVESSSGDAAANTLEITSVIVHRGDRPQPYPVLQVALTDRWQSVIGSRIVEAEDYLPAGELRDVRLRPGDRIRARARLADPGSEAAGYELHVCYPEDGAGLRCSGACP